MRPANLRRRGQDVEDPFGVFSSIIPRYPDFKFYRYLSEIFDSVEHARVQFPSPDAAFNHITWSRDFRVYEKKSTHDPTLTCVAIGQLCDLLVFENPSEAASYINKLRDLRRARGPGADFDHCILEDFRKAFPALIHVPSRRAWDGQMPVLKLAGYGTFIECSRLRLWAGHECVKVFDRSYANYPFLDVVSDDKSLNGSYAAAKDVYKIVECLGLRDRLFPRLPYQEEEVARIPRLLFYLEDISVSLLEFSDGRTSWSTSEEGEPSIERSGFADLVQEKHAYPHIFKIVPRVLLDDFKAAIEHEAPLMPEEEEIPRFKFGRRRGTSRATYSDTSS
ncbi:MAG: hypothetical protein Q9200_002772 [Gallowayella weberi]